MLSQLRQLCRHCRQKAPAAWISLPGRFPSLSRHCHGKRSGSTLLTCYKCTKTASPWPNTGPSCRPRPSWNSNYTKFCRKRGSGWRGVGHMPAAKDARLSGWVLRGSLMQHYLARSTYQLAPNKQQATRVAA